MPQNDDEKKDEKAVQQPEKPAPPKDNLVETKHTAVINGKEISYTVTCGTIVLKEETEKEGQSEGEKARASFFFTAYLRDVEGDKSQRPITFSFNGGPGSSSVWLHMGLLGPRRVEMDDMGNSLPPPYRLVENEFSLLDITDLVFIDPVSTGFSRVVPGEKSSEYHGFKKDIESVGDFIYLFTSRYKRWSSPKFLIGESYGTTRSAGLSGYLQERHGLFLNGIMLISSILDFSTAEFELGNDLPFILFLPTYTATSWYHKRLPADLQEDLHKALAEAEEFTRGEYAQALMLGATLDDEKAAEIRRKLSRLTGLSEDYLDWSNLRINIFKYTKELLRSERKTVGRLDTRFTGFDRDATGEMFEVDPSYSNILGCYTATFNQYVREELNFESDLPYEILTPKVWPWSYKEHENRYVNVAETLRKAMTMNPYLKVIVANGYYDLATPYFATQYTFNHLALEKSLQSNLSMTYYEAGHMMYVDHASLAQLHADLVAFIRSALPFTLPEA